MTDTPISVTHSAPEKAPPNPAFGYNQGEATSPVVALLYVCHLVILP